MEQNFRNELNQAIDFSSVLTQVSAFSSFSCAKEKILNALPVFDKLEIQEQLNYAKEAIQFEQAGGLLLKRKAGGAADCLFQRGHAGSESVYSRR